MKSPVSLVRIAVLAAVCSIGIFIGQLTPAESSEAAAAAHVELPNSCAIIATEATARLAEAGVWTRMLRIGYVERDGTEQGHMMTVWQPFAGSHVMIYDDYFLKCSVELPTRERDPAAIAVAFAHWKGIKVTEAHFVD